MQTRSSEYFAQLGGEPANVTILDRSPVVPAPPPLTDRFAPFLRVGLGLLAGVGLAFLAHYLDPVVRRREEIETLGLPIIAAIPRH
jgi:capsular polysaccharide biosynthesis protein